MGVAAALLKGTVAMTVVAASTLGVTAESPPAAASAPATGTRVSRAGTRLRHLVRGRATAARGVDGRGQTGRAPPAQRHRDLQRWWQPAQGRSSA